MAFIQLSLDENSNSPLTSRLSLYFPLTKPFLTVSGSIIDFQAKSFTQLNRITIITSDGREYDLVVNKDLGKFTPSHLRQHMALGDLVQASYIEDDGIKWLEDIRDIIR